MREKLQYKITGIAFIIILCLFAICSNYKLIDYYVNNVPYNEYWNPDLGKRNETDYSIVFLGKRFFIDVNGAIRNLFGQQIMNDVCKLNNGHLTALKGPLDVTKLDAEAKNIQNLYRVCEKMGVPFIYIAAPDKISPFDSELPLGEIDYSNSNIDMFLQSLNKYKVPYIDLRQEFYEDGLEQYDYFSKTDHHWNAHGGYYGYSKIREWFDRENIIYDLSASKQRNYNIRSYSEKLLGSWGQRTGKYFAGSDDFYVFEPIFSSSLTIDGGITGEYKDILLNNNLLKTKTPEFIYDGVYCNMQDVTNNNVLNDTTVLLIGDSFSRVVNPFLILSVKNFMFRSTYQSIDITEEFLLSVKPSVVILLQSPWNNLGSDESYRFVEN